MLGQYNIMTKIHTTERKKLLINHSQENNLLAYKNNGQSVKNKQKYKGSL